VGKRLALIAVIWGTINLQAASEVMGARDAAGWTQVGETRFEHCEFKDAARAFSKALQYSPDDPGLHHWLGKSYARMAEVASPLHASRDARRARVSLERAVDLAPRNQQYLRELFDFYLDSPEWFGGALGKAEDLVKRIEPDDPGAQAQLRALLSGVRQEYRGPDWRLRQATLMPSNHLGRLVP
jgi:hypothetical protein